MVVWTEGIPYSLLISLPILTSFLNTHQLISLNNDTSSSSWFPSNFCTLLSNSPPSSVKYARVQYEYKKQEDDEINLKVGDIVAILYDSHGNSSAAAVEEEGWMRGVGGNGHFGLFPENFVSTPITRQEALEKWSGVVTTGNKNPTGSSSNHESISPYSTAIKNKGLLLNDRRSSLFPETNPARPSIPTASSHNTSSNPSSNTTASSKDNTGIIDSIVVVAYDYIAQNPDELSLKKGMKIRVLGVEEDGWWMGVDEFGRRGVFPYNFVKRIPNGTGNGEDDKASVHATGGTSSSINSAMINKKLPALVTTNSSSSIGQQQQHAGGVQTPSAYARKSQFDTSSTLASPISASSAKKSPLITSSSNTSSNSAGGGVSVIPNNAINGSKSTALNAKIGSSTSAPSTQYQPRGVGSSSYSSANSTATPVATTSLSSKVGPITTSSSGHIPPPITSPKPVLSEKLLNGARRGSNGNSNSSLAKQLPIGAVKLPSISPADGASPVLQRVAATAAKKEISNNTSGDTTLIATDPLSTLVIGDKNLSATTSSASNSNSLFDKALPAVVVSPLASPAVGGQSSRQLKDTLSGEAKSGMSSLDAATMEARSKPPLEHLTRRRPSFSGRVHPSHPISSGNNDKAVTTNSSTSAPITAFLSSSAMARSKASGNDLAMTTLVAEAELIDPARHSTSPPGSTNNNTASMTTVAGDDSHKHSDQTLYGTVLAAYTGDGLGGGNSRNDVSPDRTFVKQQSLSGTNTPITVPSGGNEKQVTLSLLNNNNQSTGSSTQQHTAAIAATLTALGGGGAAAAAIPLQSPSTSSNTNGGGTTSNNSSSTPNSNIITSSSVASSPHHNNNYHHSPDMVVSYLHKHMLEMQNTFEVELDRERKKREELQLEVQNLRRVLERHGLR